MRTFRILVGIGAMTVAFIATNSPSFATADMAKKEKKPCITCHDSKLPKGDEGKKLNKTGEYYKKNKTLEGVPADKK
jgi:hypothetical protein